MKISALPIALMAIGAASSLAQTVGPVNVGNYAGFTGTFPIAPGSIASAYGDFGNIATTPLTTLTPMPKELAGTRLRVNSVDAPLYFVSRGQINFVVPVATASGRQTVEVVTGGNVVARGTVNIFPIGPGLAASTATPMRPGIIQNQNFAINGQTARARRGEVIQLYATGCGATNPAGTDGTPPTGLAPSVATVKAFVSVIEATVQYAGAHPQFPGICQINAVVPSQAFVTGQVPIFVTVNGVASNPVSVWVE